MKFTLLTLLVFLAGTEPRVSVKVTPQVLFAGGSAVVTCTVPHHINNRKVTGVIVGYTSSERQLDGEDAPRTIRFEFTKLPCETEGAKCVLEDAYQMTQTAFVPIKMAGCDQ